MLSGKRVVKITDRQIAMRLVDGDRQFAGSNAFIEALAELGQGQPLAPVYVEIVCKRAMPAEFQDAPPPGILQ